MNRSRSGPSMAATTKYTRHDNNRHLTPDEIRDGLMSAGFEYVDAATALPAGYSIRMPAIGKGPNNRSARVKLSEDGEALFWHDWPSGNKGTVFARNTGHRLSLEELAERKARTEKAKKKREAEAKAARREIARKAQRLFQGASTSHMAHPYAASKGLSSLHNARLNENNDVLLVPVYKFGTAGVTLVNLQFINNKGIKRFLINGEVKGCCSVIGRLIDSARVLVAEGWATGCTLRELHGLPVVVAFFAENLLPVCKTLRARLKDLSIVIAADDDRQTLGNPGRTKAVEAAESIGAELYFPELCKTCTCTDHNDLMLCRRRCGHD